MTSRISRELIESRCFARCRTSRMYIVIICSSFG
nr:MAG TPA: hypothetical protein [Caudoviricetes sp.]